MKRSSSNTPFFCFSFIYFNCKISVFVFFSLSRWFEAGRTLNNKAVLCKNQDLFDF